MNEDILEDRLVHLGDMMSDGLHREHGGKWIEKEYKETLKALGLLESVKRKNIKEVKCTCGSELVQSRSGSFIGKCVKCGKKFILGSRRR